MGCWAEFGNGTLPEGFQSCGYGEEGMGKEGKEVVGFRMRPYVATGEGGGKKGSGRPETSFVLQVYRVEERYVHALSLPIPHPIPSRKF